MDILIPRGFAAVGHPVPPPLKVSPPPSENLVPPPSYKGSSVAQHHFPAVNILPHILNQNQLLLAGTVPVNKFLARTPENFQKIPHPLKVPLSAASKAP